MKKFIFITAVSAALLGTHYSALSEALPAEKNKGSVNTAQFEWFDYAGDDEIFKTPVAADEYRNPILTGFHPDPSVVRVGEDYYLVNSTFGFFPGVPVFHSRDLVNWQQIGNALHRPDQVSFQGLPLTNGGIYAPAIEYRNGTFYVITTCAGCGGNFVVTATNPAGPWSDPVWMPQLKGIDPSIFFDDDGKTYVVHHRNPEPQRYPAHTALWVMEVDSKTFAPLSKDVLLIDGGDDTPWNTDYLEAPHLYKKGDTYYLSAAGGGTGYYHQQLLFKSKNIFGPYTANPNNPVLTQYGLPDERPNPVTATGHADMFEDSNGDWWAVFLGTRVYDLTSAPQDPGNFHTGRETFLLPVNWKDDWPVILPSGTVLPYTVKAENLPPRQLTPRSSLGTQNFMASNFSSRESFSAQPLAPHWLFVRTPKSQWWQTGTGSLTIQARGERIGSKQQPSVIGRRLAHMKASFGTKVRFAPQDADDEAGLLALQSDDYFYTFGVGQNAAGKMVLRVRKKTGGGDPDRGTPIMEKPITLNSDASVYLQINIDKAALNFLYSLDGKHYSPFILGADARTLTTAEAGGFVGAVVGMYAEGSPSR